MSALWTRADAVAATGGDSPLDWTATGVSIDTRTLAPGDLFVALTAARDGHDFVAEALAKGAAAALVSRRPDGVPAGAPLLTVPDVLAGLRALATAARARFRGRLVAVLGLTLLALWAASPLMKLVGAGVEAVITRLLGVLLAALAAQFVIDGIRGSIG